MKRTEVLNLGKHFTIIDSPVSFWLIDNYGFRAYRPAGAWQFDNWKLLPEKFHKIYPVYTLSIEWDSGEDDSIQITFTETDLDLGDGIAGVNGQPVYINGKINVNPVTIASPVIEDQGESMIPVRLLQNSDLEVQNKLTYGDFVCYDNVLNPIEMSTLKGSICYGVAYFVTSETEKGNYVLPEMGLFKFEDNGIRLFGAFKDDVQYAYILLTYDKIKSYTLFYRSCL